MSTSAEQTINRAVGESIRRNRKQLGLTLEDLSRLSGVGLPTLSHTENGNRDPKLSTLIKLARALRIEMVDLFAPSGARNANAFPPGSLGYDLND